LIAVMAIFQPIRLSATSEIQLATISEKSDKRCGAACVGLEIKAGTRVTVLDPAGPHVCEGLAGNSFSVDEESEMGSFSWHLTPISNLTSCSFTVKFPDVVIIETKVTKYVPIMLEKLSNPTDIDKADQTVRSSKVLDQFLENKYGTLPPNYTRYTVQDLTQRHPSVYRWPSVKDLLLLDYEIGSLEHSGPTFVFAHGVTQRITDICGGPKTAFSVNGSSYLQIGSRDCCECDMPNSEDRLYVIEDNDLKLISNQKPPE